MLDGCETFRDCRTTIPLAVLKVSTLCIIHCDFYGYSNTQNPICELCTFSQIWSHIESKSWLGGYVELSTRANNVMSSEHY